MRKLIFICILFPACLIGQDKIDSLKQLLESSNEENRFDILMELGEVLKTREPEQAIQYFNEALDIANANNALTEISGCYNNLGGIYLDMNKYDTAIQLLNISLNLRQELKDKTGTAETLYKLGRCHYYSGNYDIALENYKNARRLNNESGDILEESYNLLQMGLIYKTKSEYDDAIIAYKQALLLSEGYEDHLHTAQIFNNIGSVYFRIGEIEKALEYYNKALEIRQQKGDRHGMAGSFNNIANCKKRSGLYNEAIEYYEKALEINEDIGNIRYMAKNLMNIGTIYQQLEEYGKCLDYYKQSLVLKDSIGDKKGKSYTLGHIGAVHFFIGEYDLSIDYYNRCIKLASALDYKSALKNCYFDLNRVYSALGDYKEALRYHKLYSAIKDSILDKEKYKAVIEVQTQYETEKKEKENELLKKDLRLKETNEQYLLVKQRLLFTIIIGLILIVIIAVILLRFKTRSLIHSRVISEKEKKFNELELKNNDRERQHLEDLLFAEQQINNLQNEKIEHRNRELSSMMLLMVNKNRILTEISEKLQEVKYLDESKQNKINNILSIIDGNKILDQDWEQFKKHFEDVHKGFFENLEKNYPGLTPHDVKLCAYLRINLNTKEIARMLNVTIAAVNKSRQRLKKRLGLDADQDLNEFISKL